jgi:Family of unknown function (DUF6427)
MIGLFRSQHPLTVVLLFFYGLALRSAAFVDPQPLLRTAGDGYLYALLADGITQTFSSSPVFFPLIGYAVVFLQALMLNRQMEKDKLLPRTGFLPAMAYLLVTALMPEWWRISAALLSATLLIRVWGDMNRVFNARRPGDIIFNSGVLMGLSALIYFPSILFALFIFMAPAIMGTPRFRDWISALMGLLMPFYFFISWVYLTSRWGRVDLTPGMQLSWPYANIQSLVWVSLAMLVFPFLWGVGTLNQQIPRMLIRNRKIWTLLYVYLVLGIFISFWGGGTGFGSLFLAFIPIAAFHSVVYEHAGRPWMARLLHFMTIFAIIGWNYLVLNK